MFVKHDHNARSNVVWTHQQCAWKRALNGNVFTNNTFTTTHTKTKNKQIDLLGLKCGAHFGWMGLTNLSC